MSRFTENINAIHNNVFYLTPLLLSFYKNLRRRKRNVLLAYLILPIVLNKDCLLELKEIRSNSRLSRITMNKKCMAGFSERFEFYKQITNNCLQYAIDCNYIKIEDDLSVTVINEDVLYADQSLSDSLRLASKLHYVFKLDVLNTYLTFGIKKL